METQVIEVPKSKPVSNLFSTKEAYLSMRSSWAKVKGQSPAQHIMYNLLRGKDPKCGFTAATNSTKLLNGARPEFAFETASSEVKRLISFLTEPNRKTWDGRTFKSVAEEFLVPFGPATTFELATLAISKLK